MISADVKSNIKQEIKDLVAATYKLLQEVPSKLQIQYKKGVHFSFDFGWYSIQLYIHKYLEASGYPCCY